MTSTPKPVPFTLISISVKFNSLLWFIRSKPWKHPISNLNGNSPTSDTESLSHHRSWTYTMRLPLQLWLSASSFSSCSLTLLTPLYEYWGNLAEDFFCTCVRWNNLIPDTSMAHLLPLVLFCKFHFVHEAILDHCFTSITLMTNIQLLILSIVLLFLQYLSPSNIACHYLCI